MSPRSCRVTIKDPEGIEHTAEVTAESLYEAIALGLKAIRESSWVEGIAANFAIRVLVRDTPVEHTVEFRAFNKWLEQRGRTEGNHNQVSHTRDFGTFELALT
jgi:hypothetical protein